MNSTAATQPINKTNVYNTYAGAAGCACGCKGTYVAAGAAATRRVNEINKAIANGEQVKFYHFTSQDCYEYIRPNGHIVRAYIKH